jgi:cytochrome c biogenesis protein CcmG/thiol:disulfide interchange protein DsbE
VDTSRQERQDRTGAALDEQRARLAGRTRLWRVLGGVLALALVALLVRGLLTPTAAVAPPSATARATATPGPAAPLVGHYAPEATIRDLNDHLVPLSSYRGHVVVLNFWYVTCPPCQIEMPALQHAYQDYASRGVVVVGIDTADPAGTIDDFTKQLGITYPILRDEGLRAVRAFQVTRTPTSFILDRQGVIRYISSGPLDRSTLTRQLTALLGKA